MVTQQEKIEWAKNCINVMKEVGTYRNHKIGISRTDGGITLSKNDIVLYRDDDSKTVTTEHPCSPEKINEIRKTKSLLFTHSTCVFVPRNLIIELNNKLRFIFLMRKN